MSKKRTKAKGCQCISQIQEKLAEVNTELSLPLGVSFTGKSPKAITPRMMIATQKIESRKRKGPLKLQASFCPCCGTKYDD